MRKAVLSVIGFLALAAVIGFVATSGGSGGTNRSLAGGGGGVSRPAGPMASPAPAHLASLGDSAVSAGTASDEGVGAAAGGVDLGGGGELAALPFTQIGPSIVKTAELRVAVKAGGFNSAFQSASLVAQKYGGYVESSSTAGVKQRSGDLLIRVPSARFDEAMTDLRALGQVESQTVSGQDVTSQFVDLDARLRTWEAQESVLLKLMARANSIEATLRVQRELQDVQFRIEQIKGQLDVLQNQTDLATIHIQLHEPGAAVTQQKPLAEERPSLGEAWQRSLNAFLGVLYATVVGLGYLVPISGLVLIVLLGYRRLRPRPATP